MFDISLEHKNTYSIPLYQSASLGHMFTQVYVDGVAAGTIMDTQSESAGNGLSYNGNSIIVPVAAGVHKVDIYWYVQGNTSTASERLLKAREI
jgi:hypothetical protein